MSRLPYAVITVVLALLVGAWFLKGSESDREREAAAAAGCPSGFEALPAEYVRELKESGVGAGGPAARQAGEAKGDERERSREAGGEEGGEAARTKDGKAICLRAGLRKPEPFRDLARAQLGPQQRFGFDTPTSLARAARQAAKLRATATDIPGTAGTWKSIANGPVVFDDPRYTNTNDLTSGLTRSSGRITDFAHDPKSDRLFAAVAQGGVWMSEDRGGKWTSIGDNLPTQFVGSVGWTPAGGGTLIAVTGDNAFGGNTYGGAGTYWSTDLGKTWNKAKGAPDGAMSFRVAVRPDKPEIVYAATGFGLFRSDDAGRSWSDVELPTGDCAGKSTTKKGCFLANVVTDVRVQGPDKFGNKGGAVVAAVGWRTGPRKNRDGTVQAPGNGIYTSDDGAKGSFKRTISGFADQDVIGRVALGSAQGPDQNHGYVYALVQDAKLFNTGRLEGLDVPSVPEPTGIIGSDLTATPTYLNGVYVSSDFGRTWTKMTDRKQFLLPANGSTLSALVPLGSGPGQQSWYDEWIEPDPNAQSGGVPTNVFLGLEEVWQTRTAGTPQNGPTDFQSIAPYSNLGPGVAGCILAVTGQLCDPAVKAVGPTVHPDQHGAILLPPKGKTTGQSTLVIGNDGGAYKQDVPSTGLATARGFGTGIHDGFNTLLPYTAAVAKDGTIYAGLQDNGTVKLSPSDGMKPIEVQGGDGTNSLVDPDDSKSFVGFAPGGGGLNVSHDGGVTNEDGGPPDVKAVQFSNPTVFDQAGSKKILFAARTVHISTKPIAELAADTWTVAADLGTSKRPLDPSAVATEDDPDNVATGAALKGNTAYVGFCGSCDPVKENKRFKAGLATNVGGKWHVAAAKGLPQRQINGVHIDEADDKTVYVVLGFSTVRPYAPPQALGDDGVDPSGKYVYKSTDGGETFTDISGDLPATGALDVIERNGQLLVATTVGVYASRTKAGGEWAPLGDNLPAAPVYDLNLDPGNPDRLVVASFGRGIWDYTFKDPARAPAGCADTIAPVSRYGTRARTASASRKLKLSGTSSDRGCGTKKRGKVKKVAVSIAKAVGTKCRYLQSNGKLAKTATSCLRTRYVAAKGTTKWSFTAKRALPRGEYKVWVRGTDAAGNVERKKFARNGRKIRLR